MLSPGENDNLEAYILRRVPRVHDHCCQPSLAQPYDDVGSFKSCVWLVFEGHARGAAPTKKRVWRYPAAVRQTQGTNDNVVSDLEPGTGKPDIHARSTWIHTGGASVNVPILAHAQIGSL